MIVYQLKFEEFLNKNGEIAVVHWFKDLEWT
jgi:hypothetical protein